MVGRLNIRWKLGIVIALFMVPILLLGALFVRQSLKDINFAAQERDGISYASALFETYFGLQQLAAGVKAEVDFGASLTNLKAQGERFDAVMRTGPAAAELHEHLNHLKADAAPDALGAEIVHDSNLARSLLSAIGDGSNLILDPDLDSYYLMDLIVIRLPNLTEALRDVKRAQAGIRKAQAEGSFNTPDLLLAMARAKADLRAATEAAGKAIDFCQTGELKGIFTGRTEALRLIFAQLEKEAKDFEAVGMAMADNDARMKQLEAAVDEAFAAIPGYWRDSAVALDNHLVWRIDGFVSKLTLALGVSAMVVLLALGLAIYFSRSIVRGIVSLSQAIESSAQGDLSGKTPFIEDRTEIGIVARAVETLRLATMDKLNGEHAKARDEAVLAKAREASGAIAEELRGTIGQAIEGLNTLATSLQSRTVGLSTSSSRSIEEMGSASSRLSSTAMSIASVSSMITEFSHSIADITQQAQRYVGISREASQGSQMVSVNVKDLLQATSRIGSMAETIAGIASQTNLLALNATIEAARAGDAGRGFAVVAAEVKALAQTTANATIEITQQTRAIEQASNSFASTVELINDTITTLSEISSAIAVAIQQQQAASSELDRTVQSVATDADGVTNSVKAVVGIAEGVGAEARDIDGIARTLSQHAMRLQDEADGLIFKLKAA